MSISTILAIFALIIAASCTWMVYLAILTDRQDKVIRESFSLVTEWMTEQEEMNTEHRLWATALEGQYRELSERFEALETRLPEFDWEDPK